MSDTAKLYKLYGGTVDLYYEDSRHLYTVNSKKVDGTTSALGVIAKPALMYWAVNQAIEFLEKTLVPGKAFDEIQIKAMLATAKTAHRIRKEDAGNIGDMIHKWIEDWIAGLNPAPFVNPQMKEGIDKFLKWVVDNKVQFTESERVVYSKKKNYAGTCDFVAEIDGKLWIGDFKTSSGIYPEMWYQTAAYRQAYTEEFPEKKIAGEIIVRIGKDGVVQIKDTKDVDVASYGFNKRAFNAALTLHRVNNKIKDMGYAARSKVTI